MQSVNENMSWKKVKTAEYSRNQCLWNDSDKSRLSSTSCPSNKNLVLCSGMCQNH